MYRILQKLHASTNEHYLEAGLCYQANRLHSKDELTERELFKFNDYWKEYRSKATNHVFFDSWGRVSDRVVVYGWPKEYKMARLIWLEEHMRLNKPWYIKLKEFLW